MSVHLTLTYQIGNTFVSPIHLSCTSSSDTGSAKGIAPLPRLQGVVLRPKSCTETNNAPSYSDCRDHSTEFRFLDNNRSRCFDENIGHVEYTGRHIELNAGKSNICTQSLDIRITYVRPTSQYSIVGCSPIEKCNKVKNHYDWRDVKIQFE